MIKKIGAIVIALVLCLSVVVMPASAYELASGKVVAYVVELDKEYYSAGDTVTVSLYLYGDADTHFGAGAFVFGCSSDVFDMADNDAADVKASATTGDTAGTFYKAFDAQTWAWQTNTTVYNNIVSNNTDEENEKFDQYIKVAAARQSTSAGTHENSQNTKLGYPGSDLNAESEAGIPFVSFQLKLRDDIADGTKIEIGIPTGPMAKNYTYMDTFKTPGTATTKVKTTAANSSVVWAVDAVIGKAETPFPTDTIVNPLKGQIRFHKDDNGAYANSFDVRALAVISGDDFTATFGDAATAESKITEVGFVFAAGSNVASPSFDAVQGLVEKGTAADGYTKKTVNFISTTTSAGNYAFSCIVTDIPDADKGNSLVAVGYIAYTDANGATVYNYYPAAQTVSYTALFDAHYNTAFGA